MSANVLSLPVDIPWQRLCVSEDMIDPNVCDRNFPYRWGCFGPRDLALHCRRQQSPPPPDERDQQPAPAVEGTTWSFDRQNFVGQRNAWRFPRRAT